MVVVPIYEETAQPRDHSKVSLVSSPALRLELPVRHLGLARASLERRVGPHLAPSLTACATSFFCADMRGDQFDALLQDSWAHVAKSDEAMIHLNIRLLQLADRTRGFSHLVSSGSDEASLSEADFAWVIQHRLAQQHYTVVVDNGERIIATASLWVQCAFSHAGGLAGHIHDVGVDQDNKGCGLDSALVGVLQDLGGKLGLYKTCLDVALDDGFGDAHSDVD